MLFTIHSEFFHLLINILNRYKCGCFWCLEVEFYWIFNSKNILHAVADYIIVVSLRLYSNTMLTDTDSSTHTKSFLEKWKTDKRSCEKYIYVWCSIFSWHFVSHSFCIKQTTKKFWYSIESTLLLLFFSCIWILLVFGFRTCFLVPYWKSSNLCFLCLAIACLIVWKIDCSPVHNCFSFLLQWRWSLSIHSKFIHSQIVLRKNDAKTASRLLHNTHTYKAKSMSFPLWKKNTEWINRLQDFHEWKLLTRLFSVKIVFPSHFIF